MYVCATDLLCTLMWLGERSLVKTAWRASHSWNPRLCVLTIPETKYISFENIFAGKHTTNACMVRLAYINQWCARQVAHIPC